MIMLRNLLFAGYFITASLNFSCNKNSKGSSTPAPPPVVVDQHWQFETTAVWEDNFSTDGAADASKWSNETGGDGWGNHELEYYTPGSNDIVQSGNLIITAKKESFGGSNYTSARMVSKADWLYGRFEVRAKLPKALGTWPAIWMMPRAGFYGGWPASGEIDIMEHVAFDTNVIHWTIHTESYNNDPGTQRTASQLVPGATDTFHVYRMDWTPYAIRFYLDNVQVYQFTNDNSGFAAWPFDKNFYLILNVAVGGDWGGTHGVDDAAYPAKMLIDYVKVYKMIE